MKRRIRCSIVNRKTEPKRKKRFSVADVWIEIPWICTNIKRRDGFSLVGTKENWKRFGRFIASQDEQFNLI